MKRKKDRRIKEGEKRNEKKEKKERKKKFSLIYGEMYHAKPVRLPVCNKE